MCVCIYMHCVCMHIYAYIYINVCVRVRVRILVAGGGFGIEFTRLVGCEVPECVFHAQADGMPLPHGGGGGPSGTRGAAGRRPRRPLGSRRRLPPLTSRYLFKGDPLRLPKPLSDQFPVRVCSCPLCL